MLLYFVAMAPRYVPVTPVRDEKGIIDSRVFFVSTYKENSMKCNRWQYCMAQGTLDIKGYERRTGRGPFSVSCSE